MQPTAFLTNLTGVVVMVGWLGSIGIGAVEHDFTLPTITTPVMFLLAGYAFGIQVIKRQKNGHDEGNGRTGGEGRWIHRQ